MKAEFNRAALAEALGLVTTVVPARTPKPILRSVHLSAADGAVRVCATDLEVGITYLISEVSVGEPGDIVVPADRLTAVVRESTDEVLAFEAAEGKCEIRGADSHFTILGQDAGQSPTVPQFELNDAATRAFTVGEACRLELDRTSLSLIPGESAPLTVTGTTPAGITPLLDLSVKPVPPNALPSGLTVSFG